MDGFSSCMSIHKDHYRSPVVDSVFRTSFFRLSYLQCIFRPIVFAPQKAVPEIELEQVLEDLLDDVAGFLDAGEIPGRRPAHGVPREVLGDPHTGSRQVLFVCRGEHRCFRERAGRGGKHRSGLKKMVQGLEPAQIFDTLVEIGGPGDSARGVIILVVVGFGSNGLHQRGRKGLDPFRSVALVLVQIGLGLDEGPLEFPRLVEGLLPLFVGGLELDREVCQVQHRSVQTQILVRWGRHPFVKVVRKRSERANSCLAVVAN